MLSSTIRLIYFIQQGPGFEPKNQSSPLADPSLGGLGKHICLGIKPPSVQWGRWFDSQVTPICPGHLPVLGPRGSLHFRLGLGFQKGRSTSSPCAWRRGSSVSYTGHGGPRARGGDELNTGWGQVLQELHTPVLCLCSKGTVYRWKWHCLFFTPDIRDHRAGSQLKKHCQFRL